VRWSRPTAGPIKSVTLSREADGWSVSFPCAGVPCAPLLLTGKETGIDVGLRVFLITADAETVKNPRCHRRAEEALAESAEAGELPQEGQQTPPQSGKAARQEASTRAAPAPGLPPQDRTVSGAHLRHQLL